MTKRPTVFGAWTADDIITLKRMAAEGKTPLAIATFMSRHVSAIERQMRILGVEPALPRAKTKNAHFS